MPRALKSFHEAQHFSGAIDSANERVKRVQILYLRRDLEKDCAPVSGPTMKLVNSSISGPTRLQSPQRELREILPLSEVCACRKNSNQTCEAEQFS